MQMVGERLFCLTRFDTDRIIDHFAQTERAYCI